MKESGLVATIFGVVFELVHVLWTARADGEPRRMAGCLAAFSTVNGGWFDGRQPFEWQLLDVFCAVGHSHGGAVWTKV